MEYIVYLDECQNNDSQVFYSVEDFLDAKRNNKNCYGVFFTYFLPCITGKTNWGINLISASKDADVASVTDEAYALLALDNYWNVWCDLHKNNQSNDKRKRNKTNVQTKYTYENMDKKHRAIKYGNRGWSYDGIRKFNNLVHEVKRDRVDNKKFFQEWCLQQNRAKEKRTRKQQPSLHLLPMDDLFSGDEDDKSDNEEVEKHASSTKSNVNNHRENILLAQRGNETSSDGKFIW